jgi:hypothetical protein
MARFPVNDKRLPFKLSAQSAGVQKAYLNFIKQYGNVRGPQIFTAYANDHGVGNTLRQRCASVFTTGRKLPR